MELPTAHKFLIVTTLIYLITYFLMILIFLSSSSTFIYEKCEHEIGIIMLNMFILLIQMLVFIAYSMYLFRNTEMSTCIHMLVCTSWIIHFIINCVVINTISTGDCIRINIIHLYNSIIVAFTASIIISICLILTIRLFLRHRKEQLETARNFV